MRHPTAGSVSSFAEASRRARALAVVALAATGALAAPSPDEVAGECVLRISEIMPKPTDDPSTGTREGMDLNGLESGWVELENTSDKWANLADYKFIRTNRGKKTGQADYGNFPEYYVAPHSRAVFYTSERYSNSKDPSVSAFADGTFDGKPQVFENYGNILVWGDKVNPKKSPFVRLIHTPSGAIVDTVVVPSDLPEGWSIIVGETVAGEAVKRWMCPSPTRGGENTPTDGLKPIGPNVGPLYEIKDGKKHDSADEFVKPVPPAKPGEAYAITFPLNPVMSPTVAVGFRSEDAITNIVLVYRTDLTNDTHEIKVDLNTKSTDKKDLGDKYTVEIPAGDLPAPGHLVQWKFRIADKSGNEWTSPSFNNPDDGYEWYGTIVEPDAAQMSATLPTWHMFASGDHLKQMDVDKDDQDLSIVPNYARIAIYDSSTSNYYDYVRIDLRGNTSAGFTKKGHGLRFAKAHPLTMNDVVTGTQIKEIRKTSLISEFADPSYMRQMIAFWLWRKMGNNVPFDFPVRCNLNGEFYQLAFNSERFTDELIEDVYGLDKFGYGYKNVGTLKSGSTTTAGNIEKKTPDDEREWDISVLESELRSKIKSAQSVSKTPEGDDTGLDNADLTKFVVEKFDLPAWLNYLASARITQEMDDVWANVCAYYDNPAMKEGARGTGTWMPLGYDFNLSFGQWYYNDLREYSVSRFGLAADKDWYKSHPLYGGNRIRAYRNATYQNYMSGNDGFESVLQSSKFRRLYLRRLRTLMDQELKAPGTPETDTPFMVKMREMADLMRADAELDQARWPNDSTDDAIQVWTDKKRPATMDDGIKDIWENYVVPRRKHLYETHSITNTEWEVGYASLRNAGIPEAQSAIAYLASNIFVRVVSDGVCEIANENDEVVDMSGWVLSGAVKWALPPGTVCDARDSLWVVADRRAYVAANEAQLKDQVIVGNAEFTGADTIALAAADGTVVCASSKVDRALVYGILSSNIPGCGEWTSWTVPESAKVDIINGVASITLDGDALEQSLGDVQTNAIVASVVAEIPENASGALAGIYVKYNDSIHRVFAYANSDGTFSLRYDNNEKTKSNEPSKVLDRTRVHTWTLAYHSRLDGSDSGAKLYCDGVLVAHDMGIKWTGKDNLHLPAIKVSFGNDSNGAYPLNGMKVYSAFTDIGDDKAIFDEPAAIYAESLEESAEAMSVYAGEDKDVKAQALSNYIKYGVTGAVKLNGEERSLASSVELITMFGAESVLEEGVEFEIEDIDLSSGALKLNVNPPVVGGTLSLLGAKGIGDGWQRLAVRHGAEADGADFSLFDGENADYRFFKIYAEPGKKTLSDPVE